LWLSRGSLYKKGNLAVDDNIKKHAVIFGVDPERIIFADWLETKDHLARTRLADLALDTRIYNGGTVTSQTLWAGVPVLTLEGGHFASRMASSILQAVGMPEMVTHSLQEYENVAIELAQNPKKLKILKTKLADNIGKYPLFDTVNFTRKLEQAYKMMWQNYVNGNPPALIEVK